VNVELLRQKDGVSAQALDVTEDAGKTDQEAEITITKEKE
jgi:hypothetical protein